MPILQAPTPQLAELQPRQKDYGEWQTKFTLLSTTLQLAVPLWIERLRSSGWEHIQARAKQCSQIVGEKGDVILFRGGKKGESAAAFNALAEGIACLAFAPGGVKIFGEHWEACQEEDAPGRTKAALSTMVDAMQRLFKEPS